MQNVAYQLPYCQDFCQARTGWLNIIEDAAVLFQWKLFYIMLINMPF